MKFIENPPQLNTKYLFVLFFLGFFSIYFSSTAQTILLQEDVIADTMPILTGPNMKNYTHTYSGYGFLLGNSEGKGAEIKPGISNEFIFGVRYKRRICNFYSLGFNVYYSSLNFQFKQDSSKIFPNPVLHDKEKLAYNNAGIELYNRINFGKRGNIIGNFFDFGGYGEWGFNIRHYYRDNFSVAIAGASAVEVKNRGLLYTNKVNYGAAVRVGINRYVIYGKYRFSDLFNKGYLEKTGLTYPELPRLILGLEIGLFK